MLWELAEFGGVPNDMQVITIHELEGVAVTIDKRELPFVYIIYTGTVSVNVLGKQLRVSTLD